MRPLITHAVAHNGRRSCIVLTPHQLIIQLVLAIDAQTPASFAQAFGLPNRCAADEASLGKLLLTSHFPSGMCTVSGNNWLRLSMPGTCTYARRGRSRPRSWSDASSLFATRCTSIPDYSWRTSRLDAEEAVAEDPAPHVVVVGFDAFRLIGQLAGEEQGMLGL